MSYPAAFHRLVLIGTIYTDVWNTSVSMVPGISGSMPAVTDALLSSVASYVATWFPKTIPNAGLQISPNVKLTSIKLNRISAAGLYADPEAKEHLYPTPIAGGGTYNGAPQLTLATTLRGADERALAGRGRMYWPLSELCQTVAPDGRVSAGNAQLYAEGSAAFLAGLADVYLAAGVNSVPGIASKTRSGAFQAVETVTVGRVIDTIRSRRNKLAEDPQVAVLYDP